MKRPHPYLALFLGLFAMATAAIFIRLAQGEGIPSLAIAAGRMLVALTVLTPVALGRYAHELRRLSGLDYLLCAVGGVFLALHFAAWISSLEYTSVVASAVLVTTNPLFVILLSFPLLGERVNRTVVYGILLAFVGGVIVALSGDAGDPPTRAAPLLGNGLAVIGAICAAVYFIVGRRVRPKLSIIPYIWLVYGIAAICLTVAMTIQGQSLFGWSAMGYVWLVAMGLIPQLLGHSSFNYALGYLPAAFVSLVVLGEPIGSTLLAMAFLGEIPAFLSLVGSVIILLGIAVASRQQPAPELMEADG